MRLLSFAVGDYVSFGAVSGDGVVDLGRLLGEQYPTLGAVLRGGELHRAIALGATSKATIALQEIRYLPTIRGSREDHLHRHQLWRSQRRVQGRRRAAEVSERLHAHAG